MSCRLFPMTSMMLFAFTSVIAEESKSGLDPVAKQFALRATRTKSFFIKFSVAYTFPKGSLNEQVQLLLDEKPSKEKEGLKQSSFPPDNVVIECVHEITVLNDDLRYHYENPQWSLKTNRIEKFEFIGVVRAGVVTASNEHGSARSDHQQVRTRIGDRLLEASLPEVRPIWLCFRPARSALSTYDHKQWRPTGKRVVINGHNCVDVLRPAAPGKTEALLSLSEDEGMMPRRIVHTDAGKPYMIVEISYTPDEDLVAIPVEWTVTHLTGTGAVERKLHAKRIEYSGNPEVDPRDFTVTIRPGAIVHDAPSHKVGLAQSDGSIRDLSPTEKQMTYEQLTAPSRRWPRWTLIGGSTGLIALTVASLLLIRRRKRTRLRESAVSH